MALTFIPDGYNCRARLAGDDAHGDCEFYYRPLIHDERDEKLQLMADAVKKSTKELKRVQGEIVAERLLRWDVRHPVTGAPVEITRENLQRLPNMLYERIASIVFGDGMVGLPVGSAVELVDEEEAAKN